MYGDDAEDDDDDDDDDEHHDDDDDDDGDVDDDESVCKSSLCILSMTSSHDANDVHPSFASQIGR